MNDVQQVLADLQGRGWTLSAIADEVGVHRETVIRWRGGHHYPTNARPVVSALEGLLKRKRIPKKRRYTKTPPAPKS